MSCSREKPTIAYNGQTDFLPLNPNGVAGVLDNNARLYFQTCHGFFGEPADGAKRYGYNIEE